MSIKLSKKHFLCLIFILLLSIIISGCSKNTPSEPVSKTEFVLGTVCTISIYDKASDEVFERSFQKLKDIENKMTINAPGSEVDNINNLSGSNYAKVSDDVFFVIKNGKYYSEMSGGLFDISIGPVVKLWNIGTDKARVPSEEEIKNNLPLVDYRNIILDDAQKRIMLKNKGMIIDLGGIAKGFAADEVAAILKSYNIKHAIINLGGNVLTIGENPAGRPWRIGIQNPDASRGDYVGMVEVRGKTVVTSGIYERYFVSGGKHYHHMLSPESGYPFENELASVTIITDKSIIADAFSTSVYAKGLQEGMKYVEGQKGMEAIFITKEHRVYITSGLKKIFTMSNADFKLEN